jgi:hypothetical protein
MPGAAAIVSAENYGMLTGTLHCILRVVSACFLRKRLHTAIHSSVSSTCMLTFRRAHPGTNGTVTYKTNDSDAPFTFEFNVPYLGLKCAHILPEFRYDQYNIEKSCMFTYLLLYARTSEVLTMHVVQFLLRMLWN